MSLKKPDTCPNKKKAAIKYIYYLAVFAALLISPTLLLLDKTWHDQQRIIQIILSILSCITIATLRPSQIASKTTKLTILFIVGWGIISSFLARSPKDGLAEVSLALACLSIFIASRATFRTRREKSLAIKLITITCAIKIVQFVSCYTSSIILHIPLDPATLIDGFSNPRFFGQFQTLSLPILTYFAIKDGASKNIRLMAFLFLTSWWTISIFNGTRGTWLAMIACICIAPLTSYAGKRWSKYQLGSLAIAIPAYLLFFKLIPATFELSTPEPRLTTSLSLRDELWLQAIKIALENPLFGIGPMHLASLQNGIAAHPHQAILQIGAEWGLPPLLAATGLAYNFFRKANLLIKKESSPEYLCLYMALIGASVQSLIDGVIVMPYSQMLISFLASLISSQKEIEPSKTGTLDAILLITISASVLLLADKVLMDYNELNWYDTSSNYIGSGNLKPRFWNQGLIKP